MWRRTSPRRAAGTPRRPRPGRGCRGAAALRARDAGAFGPPDDAESTRWLQKARRGGRPRGAGAARRALCGRARRRAGRRAGLPLDARGGDPGPREGADTGSVCFYETGTRHREERGGGGEVVSAARASSATATAAQRGARAAGPSTRGPAKEAEGSRLLRMRRRSRAARRAAAARDAAARRRRGRRRTRRRRLRWIQRAADQGLGACAGACSACSTRQGKPGLRKDLVAAHAWLSLADESGARSARQANRDTLARGLTPARSASDRRGSRPSCARRSPPSRSRRGSHHARSRRRPTTFHSLPAWRTCVRRPSRSRRGRGSRSAR